MASKIGNKISNLLWHAISAQFKFVQQRGFYPTHSETLNLLHLMAPIVNKVTEEKNEKDDNVKQLLRGFYAATLDEGARQLLPSLTLREKPVHSTWTYQNEVMEWDIPHDAKVLDVGSGGWPFTKATHLADKYPEQTTDRVEDIVLDDRPFFEVDLEELPFEDKSYDFVFCSHVLEHLEDPGAAMRELMRVGKRGYIEVPTRLSDVMFNFTRIPNHHRWHGLVVDNTVVLTAWNQWERHELGNEFFNALQSKYHNNFQTFFERNRSLFFASLRWDETFDFIIIDRDGSIKDQSQLQAKK